MAVKSVAAAAAAAAAAEAAAAHHLGLNPGSATYSSFDIVPLLFHTEIGIIRIIQSIVLLRISNKRTYAKLGEQILVYDKHSISAFAPIDKQFTQI